ncbi:hypothetical protein ACLB6G_18440 [Zhengella sp. ZM62]|uniref:hypothetical protein n=1 Tax=Zhengella sedimenti TaxID=3390035 RepID=UPI003975088A
MKSMPRLSVILLLALCTLAATMRSPSAGSARTNFSGQVPPREHRYFHALRDLAVHSGPEAGYRLRIVNRSGRAERLTLELAAPDSHHGFRLIGFDPVLAPGRRTDFLLIVAAGKAQGERRLNVCLTRAAGNRAARRECIVLRTRPVR